MVSEKVERQIAFFGYGIPEPDQIWTTAYSY